MHNEKQRVKAGGINNEHLSYNLHKSANESRNKITLAWSRSEEVSFREIAHKNARVLNISLVCGR